MPGVGQQRPRSGGRPRARSRLDWPRPSPPSRTCDLGLLRLLAGVGVADDLTADIDRARALEEAITAELAARDEVSAITS